MGSNLIGQIRGLSRSVRLAAIVLASVAGSVGCWLWVALLLALPQRGDDSGGPAPEELAARIAWFVWNPIPWVMGARCGLVLAIPAVLCLWHRRILPALSFVIVVGYAVAAGAVGAAVLGGGLVKPETAIPITAVSTLGALVFVACVPLRYWTRSPAGAGTGELFPSPQSRVTHAASRLQYRDR